jgi:hypothetical protein
MRRRLLFSKLNYPAVNAVACRQCCFTRMQNEPSLFPSNILKVNSRSCCRAYATDKPPYAAAPAFSTIHQDFLTLHSFAQGITASIHSHSHSSFTMGQAFSTTPPTPDELKAHFAAIIKWLDTVYAKLTHHKVSEEAQKNQLARQLKEEESKVPRNYEKLQEIQKQQWNCDDRLSNIANRLKSIEHQRLRVEDMEDEMFLRFPGRFNFEFARGVRETASREMNTMVADMVEWSRPFCRETDAHVEHMVDMMVGSAKGERCPHCLSEDD